MYRLKSWKEEFVGRLWDQLDFEDQEYITNELYNFKSLRIIEREWANKTRFENIYGYLSPWRKYEGNTTF